MTWTAADVPSQRGRTALVTGANTGIGFETAAALAGAGARVVLACRNPEKAKAAVAALERRHPACEAEVLELDLADQGQIAEAAAEARARFDRVDLLIANAGVLGLPRTLTTDGHEVVFGTNHLGHFAFVGRVLPALLATPGSRVVTVSSMSHRVGRIRWDDLTGERRYRKASAYAQSKLANLLFAVELQRRLAAAAAATISVAAHPGFAATEILGDKPLQRKLGERFIPTPADAARPSLRAATDPGAYGGQYYGPSGLGGIRGEPIPVRPARRALDEAAQRRLWAVSTELTGVAFPV